MHLFALIPSPSCSAYLSESTPILMDKNFVYISMDIC
jgi:hypothetical protein